MGCPESVYIGDNLVFSVCTHDPDTGVLTDADAVPIYRIYEDETGTAILTGSMAKLDDDNTTGFYTESIACTKANGFENRKTYTIYIEATVDVDTGGIRFSFTVLSSLPINSMPSAVIIDDEKVFSIVTHDPSSGVLTDADSNPSYRIYEEEDGTAIANGTMAKLDDDNTAGFYTEKITCSAANGYEDRKTYTIYIEATVGGSKGGIAYSFKAYSGPSVGDELAQLKNLSMAIYNRFINAGTSLQGLIDRRFYKGRAPEGTDYPYCVFRVITDVPEKTYTEDYERVVVQFSLFSITSSTLEVENMLTYLESLYDECSLSITGATLIWMKRDNVTFLEEEHTTPSGTSQVHAYHVDYEILESLD